MKLCCLNEPHYEPLERAEPFDAETPEEHRRAACSSGKAGASGA